MDASIRSVGERERLEALLSYRILDTAEHPDFTGIAELASQICGTPISFISFIDSQRQWFKAKVGISSRESPKNLSFCQFAIQQDDIMVVEDATKDDRFQSNAHVHGAAKFRFYAGMPLISDHGFKLGTLCVIDRVPRSLTEEQKKSLRLLSRQVMNLLDLHVKNLNIQEQSAALMKSMESLERAEELTRLGSWSVDVKTGQATWSRQLYRTFQFDPNLGVPDLDNYLSRIHPDDRPAIRNSTLAMQRGEMPLTSVFRTNPDEVPLRYLMPTVRTIEDENGNVIRFEGTLLDITSQKEAETHILNEKELADTFINSLPGVFYLFDAQGKFLRWNKNLESVTGYTAEEIAAMHPTAFFEAGPAREEIAARIKQVFEEGYVEIEANFLTKNNAKIPYHFNGRRIFYEQQPCLIGGGIDISARKRAEIELRNSEIRLKAFFRSTADANILLDRNLDVLAFNPAAADFVHRFSRQDIAEGVAFSRFDFQKATRLMKKQLSLALEGKTSQDEIVVTDERNGVNVWWLASFVPAYDADGNTFGAIVNLTLIDEIKRAELKLKSQYEELQKTNQELDHFVYSVSHDLRAPLATILGLINIAELESPTHDFQNYLEMIRSSVDRLDNFIQDILNYSQNARRQISIQPIDFGQLLNEAMTDLKFAKGIDRLKVTTEIIDKMTFYSDPLRIGILFNNLLSNAIKYQDYNKSESFLSIRVTTDRTGATISFEDNGVGIEPKHLDRIFEMFFRGSEKSQGAGLGLYIVKETVGKLGGTVQVKSERSRYARFILRLPNL